MEDLQRLKEILLKYSLSLSVCESLTGGKLSAFLTSISGASEFFTGSLVSYSAKVKRDILKIPQKILIEKGTVSYDVAYEMAKNCCKLFNSDISISTTGVAGPAKLEEKEVGTVFIGICVNKRVYVKEYYLTGNRESIREKTTETAVKFLLEKLNKNSEQSP